MYYNNRNPKIEPEYEDTVIWQCADCYCWSRKEFTLSESEPACPMCNGKMHEETKNIRTN